MVDILQVRIERARSVETLSDARTLSRRAGACVLTAAFGAPKKQRAARARHAATALSDEQSTRRARGRQTFRSPNLISDHQAPPDGPLARSLACSAARVGNTNRPRNVDGDKNSGAPPST